MLEPQEIVDKMMLTDRMSQWLGLEIKSYTPGNVIVEMTVRQEMVNGFEIAHGGITYSLADSVLAFSSNAHGLQAVSIETSISHLKPVHVGDRLTSNSTEISLTKRIGVYHIEIFNQEKLMVATFKGTIYRSGKEWE
ncbi:hotdog fold thioesterase [Crocinitomix catalasitica]|uniref:hotdog fold thioesterase n=1 Tax=Crocinitomix catalasitica TaxID=184607 RepID=UPI00048731ED|nr:hotdog fold thioesterase [Crocinitomix catalasitica]